MTVHRPTDRLPSVRTTGQPMFTYTLSNYFGSPWGNWLHINVVINWQLSKQGIRWPVSSDRIAGSGVDPSRSSPSLSYPLTSYWISDDRSSLLFFLIYMKYAVCIECFHMTSRRPYWCPKTKWRPCWCLKTIPWDLNSFLMQTLSFVPINLHRWKPREWKHSISWWPRTIMSLISN